MTASRLDVRSEQEFIRDIKNGHIAEAEIAIRLCIVIHHLTNKWPSLIPAGIDFSGSYIKNDRDVNNDPDYQINGRLVEITRADTECQKYFHQKVSKVQRLLNDKIDLVFVNGFKVSKQPNFVWLRSDQLEEFTQKAISKYGEVKFPGARDGKPVDKAAFRYDTYWFNELWKPLPYLITKIPREYADLLDISKR